MRVSPDQITKINVSEISSEVGASNVSTVKPTLSKIPKAAQGRSGAVGNEG